MLLLVLVLGVRLLVGELVEVGPGDAPVEVGQQQPGQVFRLGGLGDPRVAPLGRAVVVTGLGGHDRLLPTDLAGLGDGPLQADAPAAAGRGQPAGIRVHVAVVQGLDQRAQLPGAVPGVRHPRDDHRQVGRRRVALDGPVQRVLLPPGAFLPALALVVRLVPPLDRPGRGRSRPGDLDGLLGAHDQDGADAEGGQVVEFGDHVLAVGPQAVPDVPDAQFGQAGADDLVVAAVDGVGVAEVDVDADRIDEGVGEACRLGSRLRLLTQGWSRSDDDDQSQEGTGHPSREPLA